MVLKHFRKLQNITLKMFNKKAFYDRQTHQFLAVLLISSKDDDGCRRSPSGVCFKCGRAGCGATLSPFPCLLTAHLPSGLCRVNCPALPRQGRTVPPGSCFTKKVCQIFWAWWLTTDAPDGHRGTWGDGPGRQSVLPFLLDSEATCSALPVYSGEIHPSPVSNEVEV